jgi:hypothetical protein
VPRVARSRFGESISFTMIIKNLLWPNQQSTRYFCSISRSLLYATRGRNGGTSRNEQYRPTECEQSIRRRIMIWHLYFDNSHSNQCSIINTFWLYRRVLSVGCDILVAPPNK